MNIHHLELFYYVARHGGISRAVRHITYGIQQPAVSGQLLQLERDLGVTLFERTPFGLTAAGTELYAFVRPFFENIGVVEARLRQKVTPVLRVGASEIVLRDHLPAIVAPLRRQFASLRLELRSGYQPDFEVWLEDRQIDVAIAPLERKPPARMQCLRLRQLPIVLLVHRKSPWKSADQLWRQERIEEPLICLPTTESVSRLFRDGLKRLKVNWPTATVASSLELVANYVANGYGVGVSVFEPSLRQRRDLRVLELPGFKPVEMVALWMRNPSPLVAALLEEARRYVGQKEIGGQTRPH